MHERAGIFLYDLRDFRNRKQNSRFVVGKHYRNDRGVRTQNVFQFIQIEQTVFVRLKPCYFIIFPLQFFAQISHRFVFDARRDDVFFVRVCFKRAENRPIIAFRSARSKNYFVRTRSAEQRGNPFARIFNYFSCVASEHVRR